MELLNSLILILCFNLIHYSYEFPNTSYPSGSVLNAIVDDADNEKSQRNLVDSQEATDKFYVSSKIRYRYSITEVFSKTINRNGNESREVKFQMALPEAAFISKFIIEVDGLSYKALVKEKQLAKQEYETAKIKGQTAGLIEVKEANILEVSLNIEPNNTVNFNLVYEELLLRKFGHYEHFIYINPSQLENNSTDYRIKVDILESQNLTAIVIPDLQNSVHFKSQEELSKNASILRPSGNRAIIEWTPTFAERNKYMEEGMLGQFLVRYDINRESDVGEVLLMNGYFVHFFAPPNVLPLRKHVIFILDTSGSMLGTRIQQLKEVMSTIIDDLKPDDYFNIISFSTTSTTWNPTMEPRINPMLATENHLRQAHFYIKSLRAHGATNIYSSIMNGLEVASVAKDKLPENIEPLILFLTDGEPTVGVTNCDKIRKDIKAKNNESVPIYSIAFGKEANFTFLKELSLENNGFGRKIYESGDGAIQIRGFYKEISSPLLSNVTFKYTSQGDNKIQKTSKRNFLKAFSGGEIAVAGTFVEKHKDDIIENISLESNSTEDYAISPPIFTVEINANGRDGQVMLKSDEVLYTIDVADYSLSNNSDASTNKTLPTAEPGHPEENHFLERLWAYLTVKQLLDMHPTEEHLDDYEYMLESNEVLDADQPTLPPIPELPKSNESSADRALRLSLKYGFVTPVTSLVVVKPDLKSGNITQESANLTKASLTETVSPKPSPPLLTASNIQSPPQMQHRNQNGMVSSPGGPLIYKPDTYAKSGHRYSGSTWGASRSYTNRRGQSQTADQLRVYSAGMPGLPIFNPSNTGVFSTTRRSDLVYDDYKEEKLASPVRFSFNSQMKQPRRSTGLDLSDIDWLPRNASSVIVNGNSYTLKKSNLVPVSVQNYRCENKPATSSKVRGNCDHLENCVLKRMTKNKLDYTLYYFCPLENDKGEQFAGICCPDDAWI